MARPSDSKAPLAPAIFAVLMFAILAVYIAGYFGLCRVAVTNEEASYRVYTARWQATIYRPMAYLESLVTGKKTAPIVPPNS
jgi:hypothetical protein